MEEQLEAGKVKSLGIAGFSKAELDLLLQHAKHKPVVHQMEITPYLQQTEFVEYNKSLGISPRPPPFFQISFHTFSTGIRELTHYLQPQ